MKIHMERRYIQHEMQFEIDSLFDMIFDYRIGTKIQMVLAKCMDCESVTDVSTSTYDFTPILEEIENNIFRGTLPTSILVPFPCKVSTSKG